MLLCLLLTGLVGKSYASKYNETHKKFSSQEAEHQAKLDIYQMSVEAIIPFLLLDVPHYDVVLFEDKASITSSATPVVKPLRRVQEQYFKTLFQDIISPNAP